MSRSPIAMEKRGGRLVPIDAYASEQVDLLPEGKTLSVRVSVMTAKGKTEREGNRGLMWAGINLLADNTDSVLLNSPRKAYEYMLTALGYVRPRFRIDGSYDMIPMSTSEEAMDDSEHALCLERMRAWSVQHLGVDYWQSWIDENEAANANRRYR